MKRVIAAAIILVMVLGTALAGCDKDKASNQEIVTLLWPLELVAENPEDFNEEEFLKKNDGFTQAILSDDETMVTVSMKEDTFDFIKNQFRQTFEYSLEQLVDSEPTEYIKAIDYEPEFRNIEVKVIKEDLDDDEMFRDNLLQIIAINIAQYHQITGQEVANSLTLIDQETSAVINSLEYPVDLTE